jgi:hypothetical protein
MKYTQVRASECAEWAKVLREALQACDVAVHRASDVGRMIAELEWLGTFPPDAPQPDAAWAENPARAKIAFPLYEQAIRVAQAVAFSRGIPGARERVLKLRKRLDRLTTQDEQAQDFLFELEVGARFTRLGLTITFDEPDIVMHSSEGHRLGLACKRPRNVDRLRERLGEAADQITAGDDQGLIVIGVEPLFHKSHDPERPTVTYLGDASMVRAEANRILDNALGSARLEIVSALGKGVAGILFCGVVTGWARQVAEGRDAYHYQWIHRAISHPDALELAQVVETKLFPDDVDDA